MIDPSILFVKPKAISQRDKETLQSAGVVVVEIDDPANAKFIRANSELSSTEMLNVAMLAISQSTTALDAFGRAINFALLKKGKPTTQPAEGTGNE